MLKIKPLALSIASILALAACQPPAADNSAPAQNNNAAAPAVNADGTVNIAVNDAQCEPMELTVPSGKTTFNIVNNSARKLEWEILEGVMVVDERENIAPGLTDKMTVTLLPGEYAMTCGLLTNPRGKLIVTDSGFQAPENLADMSKLAQPLADYKVYVQAEAKVLVEKTDAFVAAVKAGEIDKAKAMFADTRVHYERIEPIAELFGELDPAIDAREDDFKSVTDPEFTGFHRIEYALWEKKSVDDVKEIADKLAADVKALAAEIDALNFPPHKVVGGAAVLIEEVAGSKISGEEDRYSKTDLSDFKANVEGAEKIVELFRAVINEKDPALLQTVDGNLKTVNDILAKYKTADGFQTYDKLSEEDRKNLAAPINTLAEELAKLRGTLGLN
ncbi:MAG: iron uptake system protein EfeO [Neisseriaceae bacterium]|nr:iron uptake system protein EfeO [Neisseriaceae bacterium]